MSTGTVMTVNRLGFAESEMLTQDGHDARTYPVTGRRALSMDDVAAQLSAALGRRIRYRDVPPEAARAALRCQGVSGWEIEQMQGSAEAFDAGEVAEVTDVVARLAGRPPRTFAQFADNLVRRHDSLGLEHHARRTGRAFSL